MQSSNSSTISQGPLSLLRAQAKYGEIHNGIWGNEREFCKLWEMPEDLHFPNWINSITGFPISHIYCNVDFAPHLEAALRNVQERGLTHELKTFDGCYAVRDVRAMPGTISCHSYAMAIDLNAFENKLGGKPTFSAEFVEAFLDPGFIWGGHFKRVDGMHFTLGW